MIHRLLDMLRALIVKFTGRSANAGLPFFCDGCLRILFTLLIAVQKNLCRFAGVFQ